MLPSRFKLYLVGVCSGAVLVANYRSLTKETIKAGVRGMTTLRRVAARGAENLADLTHEALSEMNSTGADGDARPAGAASHLAGSGANGSAASGTARNGSAAGPKEQVTTRSEG